MNPISISFQSSDILRLIRLDSSELYILIILWILLVALSYWWRSRVTETELESAQLIGGPMEEQWRLGSEGKMQLEELTEEESAAEASRRDKDEAEEE